MSHKLFVYGSLLSNLKNHHIMTDLGQDVKLLSQKCVTVEKFFLSGLNTNEYPFLSEVCLKDDQVSCQIKGSFLIIRVENRIFYFLQLYLYLSATITMIIIMDKLR
jgi:gamma-glutamylcyclotransferase (GGCT)/AIG2-like uncharacterized protein YtfP